MRAARRSFRSSRSARRRRSTNTRFWSPRSMRRRKRSVSSIRDRGDGENVFDEMKNQWGWGGFTTHDLARCRLAARLIALIYNWWNIFVRLALRPSLREQRRFPMSGVRKPCPGKSGPEAISRQMLRVIDPFPNGGGYPKAPPRASRFESP
jgi:hypothetical protein